MLIDLRNRVEDGSSLADAVVHHPDYFDPISCHMIAAGESTGKMSAMLDRLSVLMKKQL